MISQSKYFKFSSQDMQKLLKKAVVTKYMLTQQWDQDKPAYDAWAPYEAWSKESKSNGLPAVFVQEGVNECYVKWRPFFPITPDGELYPTGCGDSLFLRYNSCIPHSVDEPVCGESDYEQAQDHVRFLYHRLRNKFPPFCIQDAIGGPHEMVMVAWNNILWANIFALAVVELEQKIADPDAMLISMVQDS